MAVHLLASSLPSGERVMDLLLRSARQITVRLSAVAAPFETREILKRRGYHWHDGADGLPKAWWKELPQAEVPAEVGWLATHIYRRGYAAHESHRLDATLRYSARLRH
jgi:DNA polymerase-3 subunit epsilon